MKSSQAEILLRIAENRYADGDDLIAEMRRTGAIHARALMDDKDMLERALEINKQDCARFAQYMPRQDTRQEPRDFRHEPRHELGNQNVARAVLAPVKKVAE